MSSIKVLKQHKLVLDTHIWIWLMSGEDVFKKSFLQFLDNRGRKPLTFISPISFWEVGMLSEKGRIELGKDRLEWVEESLVKSHFEIAPITPRIAIQSTRLPGNIHGDPADRILISTAHEINAVLVSCDQQILSYGKDRYLDVYDPCKN